MTRYDLLADVSGYRDMDTPVIRSRYVYVKSDNGSYDFDDTTQQFTNVGVGGDYVKHTVTSYEYHNENVEYDSYVDTINIVFNTEDTKDKSIKLSINSSPSTNDLKIQFASNSNYVFNDSVIKKKQGQTEHTASFQNGDNIRYMGTKQIINNPMPVNQKNASSIKYRISFDNSNEDDNNILSITNLTAGLISDGDFNG